MWEPVSCCQSLDLLQTISVFPVYLLAILVLMVFMYEKMLSKVTISD